MENIFSDIELDLLDIIFPVPNYLNEQKILWQKIRSNSTAPLEVLDKIEDMLPGGKFYDSKGGDYACDGAAFFAMLQTLSSPIGINSTDHKILFNNLIKLDSIKGNKLVLIYFQEVREVFDPDFHFVIDLGLKGNERISFHKPGFNPPWLTFTKNIIEYYVGYRIEYFSLPKVEK